MTLKILFFGIGSIGKRHARLINEKFEYDIFAYRTNYGQEKSNLKIPEFDKIDDAFLINPDIAFITNPTYLHLKTALECAKHNINLFIEKPISHNLEKTNELDKEIKNRGLFTYVAYNLRFHPIIQKLYKITKDKESPLDFEIVCSSYLPDWRPNQNYTKTYSAKKELGGGVILDLSHEFDYITWLFGNIKEISGECGKKSNLKISSEDYIDAIINLETGANGKLHLDYFTKKPRRTIKINYDDLKIEADLIKNTLKLIDKNKKIKEMNFSVAKDETYIKQLDFFFENFKKRNLKIMNNYSEALKTFNKIIKFKNNYCDI
jgi:predicted dehydrogenase